MRLTSQFGFDNYLCACYVCTYIIYIYIYIGGVLDPHGPVDWRKCKSVARILASCPAQAASLEDYYCLVCPQVSYDCSLVYTILCLTGDLLASKAPYRFQELSL